MQYTPVDRVSTFIGKYTLAMVVDSRKVQETIECPILNNFYTFYVHL